MSEILVVLYGLVRDTVISQWEEKKVNVHNEENQAVSFKATTGSVHVLDGKRVFFPDHHHTFQLVFSWDCSNDRRLVSLEEMSFTDPPWWP